MTPTGYVALTFDDGPNANTGTLLASSPELRGAGHALQHR